MTHLLLLALTIVIFLGSYFVVTTRTDESLPYTHDTTDGETPAAEKETSNPPEITPVTESSSTKIIPVSTLDLSNQQLTKVPKDIFEKTNIEKLDISHNNLTGALQAEVRNLSSLRVLDMSNNQFTGVPAEIGQLKKLETLNLSNNQLTGLPYELGNLQNLKLLDLRGNNYAIADLEIIRKNLPSSVTILVD